MTFDKPLHIISIYAPDISKLEEISFEFYDTLQSELNKISQRQKNKYNKNLNARIGKYVVDGVNKSIMKM